MVGTHQRVKTASPISMWGLFPPPSNGHSGVCLSGLQGELVQSRGSTDSGCSPPTFQGPWPAPSWQQEGLVISWCLPWRPGLAWGAPHLMGNSG